MPDWTNNHNHADCRKPGTTRSIIPRWVPPRHRGRVLFHHAPARMRRGRPPACPVSRLVSDVPHSPPAHTSERPRPCHAAHYLGYAPAPSASLNRFSVVRTAIAILTISRPLCPHRTRACALLRQVQHQDNPDERVRAVVPPVHTGGATICRLRFLPLPPSPPSPSLHTPCLRVEALSPQPRRPQFSGDAGIRDLRERGRV